MQLRDLLKDIFTDLQDSCIKCNMDRIQRTCQFEDPSMVQSFALNKIWMDQSKVEGYSTQLEALCQRIDMIELEMENLKSHHINVVQSQKVKDTKEQATSVGLSLIISKSELSMKRGSSTSPETRDAQKSMKGSEKALEKVPERSLLEKVRFELNQIYMESIENQESNQKIQRGAKQSEVANKSIIQPLFMCQKRSQPAPQKLARKDSYIQVIPQSTISLNIGEFLNQSHACQISDRFGDKDKNDQLDFQSSMEMQLAPPNLEIEESLVSDQKKSLLSHNQTRFQQSKSSDQEYSFETMSVKNVKMGQNIDLDYNLVEQYEENRSDVEFIDQEEDSLKEFQSEENQNQVDFLKIQMIQSQKDYSPQKNDYFSDDHTVDKACYFYQPHSHREQFYSRHPLDFHSSYQYTGDYQNGSMYQELNPSSIQNNFESRCHFRKQSHETHDLQRRIPNYLSANSPQNTPNKRETFGAALEKTKTDSPSPNFNPNIAVKTLSFPQNHNSIQKNLFGKLSDEKSYQEYLAFQEQNGYYGRPRAYSSPQSIKHTFDQSKVCPCEGRSSGFSGGHEHGRSSDGLVHDHRPIQIIQEETSNNDADPADLTPTRADDYNDTPFTVLEPDQEFDEEIVLQPFDHDHFDAPQKKSMNQLYVSKSPQIKPIANQTRIMNLRNLYPVNQYNQVIPQTFCQQTIALNYNQNGFLGPQQQQINRFQSNFQKPQNIQFKPLYPNFPPTFHQTDLFEGNFQLPQNQIFGPIRNDAQPSLKAKGQLSLLDSNGQLQIFQPTRPVFSPPPMMMYNQNQDINNKYFGNIPQQMPMRATLMEQINNYSSPSAESNHSSDKSKIIRSQTYDQVKIDELEKKSKITQDIALNNKPIVNFIRIEKHQPTRKNIHDPIIFWNEEQTDDYKFSQYLEQNRYERLFKEISIIGEGGFGKVYKAQHVLDQRIYAIKKIQIHLGINQDFKMHHVYKEIVAISQVLHKNVVRYYACWIECVSAKEKHINKVCKKLEYDIKKDFKKKRPEKKITISEELFDMNKPLSSPRKLKQRKMSFKEQITTEMIEDKWRGKNLLQILEDDGEVLMDEDWEHQKKLESEMKSPVPNMKSPNPKVSPTKISSLESAMKSSSSEFESSQSDSDSSSGSSSGSVSNSIDSQDSNQEKSFKCTSNSMSKTHSKLKESSEDSFSSIEEEEESDDCDCTIKSYGSLYQLIEKEKNFITLNVMIQMEHCNGDTLREFLDTKDYTVNRKINYHYFKQLIQGLQHIHEEGLIHRDIKPANIFIDKARMSLKIGDFGLAKQNNVQQQLAEEIKGLKRQQWSLADLKQYNNITTIQSKDHLEKKQLKAQLAGCKQISAEFQKQLPTPKRETSSLNNDDLEASICAGTPMYQAPEQTMHQIQISKKANEPICLTDKVDMFAAGLILYELCSNFKTQHQRIQKFSQLRSQRVLDEDLFKKMPEERDIILNLTDPDPKKRSSAIYLLNSKTFQSWSFESKQ